MKKLRRKKKKKENERLKRHWKSDEKSYDEKRNNLKENERKQKPLYKHKKTEIRRVVLLLDLLGENNKN